MNRPHHLQPQDTRNAGRPQPNGTRGRTKTESTHRSRGGAPPSAAAVAVAEAAATANEPPLAVALRGDSQRWLCLALEQAQRNPLGVALDAAALWAALRERALHYLEIEQQSRA